MAMRQDRLDPAEALHQVSSLSSGGAYPVKVRLADDCRAVRRVRAAADLGVRGSLDTQLDWQVDRGMRKYDGGAAVLREVHLIQAARLDLGRCCLVHCCSHHLHEAFA